MGSGCCGGIGLPPFSSKAKLADKKEKKEKKNKLKWYQNLASEHSEYLQQWEAILFTVYTLNLLN